MEHLGDRFQTASFWFPSQHLRWCQSNALLHQIMSTLAENMESKNTIKMKVCFRISFFCRGDFQVLARYFSGESTLFQSTLKSHSSAWHSSYAKRLFILTAARQQDDLVYLPWSPHVLPECCFMFQKNVKRYLRRSETQGFFFKSPVCYCNHKIWICAYGVFPKMVVAPKHPKMIIFSRKTHVCRVPPF